MGSRVVRKKEASDNLLDELKIELRQVLNETALRAAHPDGIDLSAGLDFRTAVTEYERNLILAALRTARGQKKRAARLLKMSPSTLHGKMSALGIDQERFS